MSQPSHPGTDVVLRGYFHAKDENRPHLLCGVFAEDAELMVDNKSASIAFPAITHGREAIADVLVRRFAQSYENIYSFYMARPSSDATRFACDWLVGMSEKDTGSVRVGCGRYDWFFRPTPRHLASHLVITVEVMQVLPPSQFAPIFTWLRQLDYPWSSAAAVQRHAPGIEMLAPVLRYLERDSSA